MAKDKGAKPAEPVTVTKADVGVVKAAVLTASSAIDPLRQPLAAQIEAAMSQAVKDQLMKGVSIDDSATIKAAMLKARAHVLAAYYAPPPPPQS